MPLVSCSRRAVIALMAALAMPAIAQAAELKVISAGAVRGVLRGMIEEYARQSGHTFDFTIGSTGRLREVIASGEPAPASRAPRCCRSSAMGAHSFRRSPRPRSPTCARR